MDIQLENMIKSNFLREKLSIIIKEKENLKKSYIRCMALLEHINVKLLTEHFKIEMPDNNIIRIMTNYLKVDKELFKLMMGVNAEYETIDLENIKEDDIKDLLYDIDFIYGHILNKYGNIIN